MANCLYYEGIYKNQLVNVLKIVHFRKMFAV